MATTVLERAAQEAHEGFTGEPRYYREGDYLTCFLRDERCFSRRVNEYVTIYTAIDDDDRLVGCKVKGLRHLCELGASIGVFVSDGEVSLSLILLQVAAKTGEPETRDQVLELAQTLKGTLVPKNELNCAA
jgi:hypothetical protein